MDNNLNKTSLADKILGKLKSGKFQMRPKVYFVLRAVLAVLVLATVVLFALFLVSFISFCLRANGILVLPIFGFKGLGMFLASLPWLLIIVAIFLVVVLEITFKHFAFAYRRPILYSLLGILVVVSLGVFIIDRTSFHTVLFDRAKEGKLPMAGSLYRGFGMPQFHDNHFGVVASTTNEGFIIKIRNGETLNVIVGAQTRLPLGQDIGADDTVMVLGRREGNVIKADGVIEIKINDRLKSFP